MCPPRGASREPESVVPVHQQGAAGREDPHHSSCPTPPFVRPTALPMHPDCRHRHPREHHRQVPVSRVVHRRRQRVVVEHAQVRRERDGESCRYVRYRARQPLPEHPQPCGSPRQPRHREDDPRVAPPQRPVLPAQACRVRHQRVPEVCPPPDGSHHQALRLPVLPVAGVAHLLQVHEHGPGRHRARGRRRRRQLHHLPSAPSVALPPVHEHEQGHSHAGGRLRQHPCRQQRRGRP